MILRSTLIGFIAGASMVISPHALADEIELREYIEMLRQEFMKLSDSPGKEKFPIYLGPIHVELTALVRREGGAGVKFYVVDASGKLESAYTQKLSFDVSIGNPGEPWLTWQPRRDMWPHGSAYATDAAPPFASRAPLAFGYPPYYNRYAYPPEGHLPLEAYGGYVNPSFPEMPAMPEMPAYGMPELLWEGAGEAAPAAEAAPSSER